MCDNASSCSAGAGGARVTSTDWYPSGELERRTKPNSAVETRAYFEDGRISQMRRVANGVQQKDQTYDYDENGNRTRDERGTYLHSARDGLIKWTRSNGSTVSYRLMGSRAIKQSIDTQGPEYEYRYSGDRLDEIVASEAGQTATATLEYDALGATRFMRQQQGTTEYQYDEFERLRRVKGFGAPAGQSGDRYCYDALDRRALRIESSNTTATCATATPTTPGTREYAYVGLTNMLAREQTDTGAIRTYDYDSSYNRLGRSKVGDRYQSYAHDANGSVEGIEHADGTLPSTEQYPYDPYGRLESASRQIDDPPDEAENELATADMKDNPFRFQGFYYDAGTQTYDMQARDYRPDIARFLSVDRYSDADADLSLLADPVTQNRYAFAGGNPITLVEVDGHEPPSSFTNPCDPIYGSDERCSEASEEDQERSASNQQRFTYAYSENWKVGRATSPESDQRFVRQYVKYNLYVAEEAARRAQAKAQFERTGEMPQTVFDGGAPESPRPDFDNYDPGPMPWYLELAFSCGVGKVGCIKAGGGVLRGLRSLASRGAKPKPPVSRPSAPSVAKEGARGVDQGFAVGQGFRSFSQFKRVLGPAGEGRQWHHLVEQTPGNVGRFGPEAIHNTGNLVRLDTQVHRKVSGFFSSKQPFTGGQTVRQWASGQSYARQQQFARQVMERFGG